MKYKPIYEFLVWDNCNNNCKFCFQRENPRLFNHEKRKMILNEVLSFIDSDKFIKGSHILVCGGEIFDKPQDYEIFNNFFQQIIDRMNKNVIDLLYINTNLIYNDKGTLRNFLDLISENHLFERLKFTTSYDLEGRFDSSKKFHTYAGDKTPEEVMLHNLKWIKLNYPSCQIVTNTILTKPVCKAIINKDFSVKYFMNEYKCWVNLIPYIVLDETLTPSREQIFKALQVVGNECKGYLEKYIPNMSITQEKWLYMYKDNEFKFCSCELSPECGHSINFKRYSKKGTCFCCDIKEVFGDL